MEYNNQIMPFHESDVDWMELASIGISKDLLEMNGELETLMSGERTNPITLELTLLGVDVTMDATLQIIRKDNPIIEIIGIKPLSLN